MERWVQGTVGKWAEWTEHDREALAQFIAVERAIAEHAKDRVLKDVRPSCHSMKIYRIDISCRICEPYLGWQCQFTEGSHGRASA